MLPYEQRGLYNYCIDIHINLCYTKYFIDNIEKGNKVMSDLIKAARLFTDGVVDIGKDRSQLLLIPDEYSIKSAMDTFEYVLRTEDSIPWENESGEEMYSHWCLSTYFSKRDGVLRFNYPSGSTLRIRKIQDKDNWYGLQYSDIIMPNQCPIETKMLAMARLRSMVVSDLNLYFY